MNGRCVYCDHEETCHGRAIENYVPLCNRHEKRRAAALARRNAKRKVP